MSDKKKVVTFPHADQRLMGRARGAIVYRSYHGPLTLPDARISTLSDLINAALAAYLSELEQHYTGGTPFAAPEHLPRGRKRGAARQIDTSGLEKANAYLRPEIVERLRGAITYADASGPLLGQIDWVGITPPEIPTDTRDQLAAPQRDT